MRYATWKLNFSNPDLGTGPESKIIELGTSAQGAFSLGEVQDGGLIIGYVFAEVDASELSDWQFGWITQEEVLLYGKQLNPAATLDEAGFIVMPMSE